MSWRHAFTVTYAQYSSLQPSELVLSPHADPMPLTPTRDYRDGAQPSRQVSVHDAKSTIARWHGTFMITSTQRVGATGAFANGRFQPLVGAFKRRTDAVKLLNGRF